MPKGKLHQDESTSQIPEASGLLDENGVRSMAVQRAFISYLARKLGKTAPGFSLNECAVKVVEKTGAKFREWLKGLADVETNSDFLGAYGPPEGPERIFTELFPNQSIDDFLKSCLNGDENNPASRRSDDIREQALDTINK